MRIQGQRDNKQEKGMALPAVLFMILFLSLATSLTARVSQENVKRVKLNEAVHDTFYVSEGVAHDLIRKIATNPELWRDLNPLADLPYAYTLYSPANYSSSNGIPTCSGTGCHRNLYPTGGGIVKNVGPLGGEGEDVNTSYAITDQLDISDAPVADTVLNGTNGWVQVERMEEITPSAGSVGGGLENNDSSGTNAGVVRFRVTATSFRSVRSRQGLSTVVYIVEVPAA